MSAEIPQIGDIVRSAREGMGLSQTDFAKMLAVSKQTVNSVEQDRWFPRYEMFYRLVHLLNVSADLFIYPDREPYTLEQEQFIREMLTCNERERNDLRYLLRALRHDDEPEKQS